MVGLFFLIYNISLPVVSGHCIHSQQGPNSGVSAIDPVIHRVGLVDGPGFIGGGDSSGAKILKDGNSVDKGLCFGVEKLISRNEVIIQHCVCNVSHA